VNDIQEAATSVAKKIEIENLKKVHTVFNSLGNV
jgi:hypothetical protein